MRRLIVSEFVTLDGVMEAPGGEASHPHAGWVSPSFTDDLGAFKFGEVVEAQSLLLGRVTYESFAEAWPQRDGEFADRMNAMHKDIASATLVDPAWNATSVLEGDVPAAVDRLRAGDGGPILVNGSRTLLHTLLAHGLVDELRLQVFPVALGSGDRLFPTSSDPTRFALVDQRRFDGGATLQVYEPAAA